MDISDIYSQVILEHSSSKKHRKDLNEVTFSKRGVNPSCGDDITLELFVEKDIIVDASFKGVGCAISQASTSIMIDQIKGKTLDEAKHLANLFIKLIKKENLDEIEIELLGDGIALQNISNLPGRVKCATLSWHTLNEVDK